MRGLVSFLALFGFLLYFRGKGKNCLWEFKNLRFQRNVRDVRKENISNHANTTTENLSVQKRKRDLPGRGGLLLLSNSSFHVNKRRSVFPSSTFLRIPSNTLDLSKSPKPFLTFPLSSLFPFLLSSLISDSGRRRSQRTSS